MANKWRMMLKRWDELERRAHRAALWFAVFVVVSGSVAYALDTWGIFRNLSMARLIIAP